MNVLNVHITDRSDIDSIVCITKDGDRLNRLDMARRGELFPRKDIALVNLYEPHCDTCDCQPIVAQATVYATLDGPVGEGLDYLSDVELARVEAINDSICRLVQQHPEMEFLLS